MAASSVKSAERTLDVLSYLASRVRPAPSMAIAQHCGIPKSSMYHLLNVLHERRWVIYYERERAWGLGSAAMEVGFGFLRSAPLQHLGRPLLHDLALATESTAQLAVLHGIEVLFLDKEDPADRRLNLLTAAGIRLPAHLTGVGLAALAALEPGQVNALYGRRSLARLTERGARTLRELHGVLATTRERGYALEEGLVTRGVISLGVPVLNPDGFPIAAFGIAWVDAVRPDADIEQMVSHVRYAAETVSAQLAPGASSVA